MSGGSFDNLWYALEDKPIDGRTLERLHDMENYCRSIGKHDVADELLKTVLNLETMKRRIEVIAGRVIDLAQAVEWYCSGDWGLEAIDDRYERLLDG